MAEHDFIIDNGTGSAVRTDLNNVLQAIASNNSKSGALTTNYAYQWHVDTSDGNLKIRNASNNGYVTVGPVATTNFGLAPLTGGTFTGKVTHNYTSSLNIPSGTTAQRDGSPAVGMLRHNSTLNQFEGYNNGAWDVIGGDNSTTSTITDESSDTTCFPLFATAATGDLGLKSGSNLTFNSSNGTLAATTFSGSGASLTNLPSSALTGALPAIDGSALTGISSGLSFAQWRVNTLWSGAADPIVNWTESDKNVTFTESSGIFTFPSTGHWHIMCQLYGYKNDDQDNIELHIMTTTNNSSYSTKSWAYSHMNNDDGGNLYTSVHAELIFDVTSTTNCKVKFKTINNTVNWAADSSRNDSYAIFTRLGDT